MFSEAQLNSILFAPIVVYCLLGALIFVPVRFLLGRLGVFSFVWHPALFELAIYFIITGALILFVA